MVKNLRPRGYIVWSSFVQYCFMWVIQLGYKVMVRPSKLLTYTRNRLTSGKCCLVGQCSVQIVAAAFRKKTCVRNGSIWMDEKCPGRFCEPTPASPRRLQACSKQRKPHPSQIPFHSKSSCDGLTASREKLSDCRFGLRRHG